MLKNLNFITSHLLQQEEKLDWIATQLYMQMDIMGNSWGQHQAEEFHRIFGDSKRNGRI